MSPSTLAFFLLGFPALIGGAEALIRGAGSLAKRLGVSDLVVGLTVVALGTSAPELVVSLLAATRGSTDLAVANVVGSNLSNLLLILGATAVFFPLAMAKKLRWREIPFVLLSSLLLLALANDRLLDGAAGTVLGRTDGLALLGFLAVFFYFTFSSTKKGDEKTEVSSSKILSLPVSLAGILLGAAGLALGGDWLVSGAVEIAAAAGMSEALIGLTIVAVGTSLPELAASISAARARNADLVVGNIVGSNVMNIFWILGLSATISPLDFSEKLNADLLVLSGATILFFLFTFTGKKHKIDRWEGALLLAVWLGFLAFAIWRG
jgi:cation:H+ antiporter